MITARLNAAARRSKRAFSLLEIIIVLVIISMLMGIAVYIMGDSLGFGRETTAKTTLGAIRSQLLIYQSRKGTLPTQSEGLGALVAAKIYKKVPVDPWGNEYVYERPGRRTNSPYDLYSKGADVDDPSDDIVLEQ